MTEADAHNALQAAWDAGIRFYDTSPFYGFGLSERRYGQFLHTQRREDYTLSTKVGLVFTAGAPAPHPLWKEPSPFTYRYDYTADGVTRAIEDSLQRLGVDRIDIVFVHDLAADNDEDLRGWQQQFAITAKGAFPALTQLREAGVTKAWGLGVNRIEPIQAALRAAEPDVCLLATQYSLSPPPSSRPAAPRLSSASRSTPASCQVRIATSMATASPTTSRASATAWPRSQPSTASISGPPRCSSPRCPTWSPRSCSAAARPRRSAATPPRWPSASPAPSGTRSSASG